MASEPKKQATPAKTPKQLAAEARAASEAAERRRERMIRIVGTLVVVAIVGALLAIGFFAGRGDDPASPDTAAPTPDPSAAAPGDVVTDPASAQAWGVPYGASWTADNQDKLPTMEIWEDFQCPFCGQFEVQFGPQLEALADAGKVKLLYRPAIFLDNSLAQKNAAAGNPNSSARATNAWGCAIEQGRTSEYHSALFAAQPTDEGTGYSEQTLLDLGTQVGVPDQAAFTTCVREGTYLAWAANSNQAFYDAEVGGTPRVFLNGTEVPTQEFTDMAAIEAKIEAATAT
ncbi:MAG: DsbA family protein [Candidatus Nanopelagicales bacterium]|jgi:protein-disulfide isomerase|nr:DsbA family protein [Candidatus Nanopelagicales bacterium]